MAQSVLKILIVDDDEGDRKHLARTLREAGQSWQFTEATSIREALDACDKRTFHCAIIDYRMPGVDGLFGIGELHERHPYLAIIMATGQGDEVIATEAMKRGASDYIPKAHFYGGTIRRVIEGAVEEVAVRRMAAQQREEMLQQFAEREQLLIAAVASSNDAIVTKSLEGVISGWNRAAEILFGFTAEEAIGQSIDIIVPAELRAEARDNEIRIRRSEYIDHHETVRQSKGGRRIDVSLSVSPIRSPSGATIGAATVARDITDKKQAVQALLESERVARGIIDTALDAFVQMDEAGNIIDWNLQAQEIFGWSRDEVVGRNLGALIVPDSYRARHQEGLARFLLSGKETILGKRLQMDALHKGGCELKVEFAVTALRRGSGYVFNGFIRDITEKLAAEAQFRQAQKMEVVGQLTGGIAHDFNNMLTVITGTIELLAEAVAENPKLAEMTGLISDAADRGVELTRSLLAFARKQPLQPCDVGINDLVLKSEKLIRPTLGEQIEIRSVLEDDIWPAFVDPGQLSTALLNLAINARDAMPDGGKLTLETHNVVFDDSDAGPDGEMQPGNYVMIAVSDTGTGIPRAIREKVFEPFFSTKEVGKGTGLGLSMVYGFVKQSKGHIRIYSEERHGSTFRIYLPRAVVSPSTRSAEIAPEIPMRGGNETILVVEDDALVRRHVTSQLQSLGYRTISAANATEALALADSGAAFDLLFSDVIMPGSMNGCQLAEALAKRGAPSRVLFTSGYPANALIHHGRLDPGILLLTKPYRRAALARMLRVALNVLPVVPDDEEHTVASMTASIGKPAASPRPIGGEASAQRK
jgi:PAS domain S-box-containing protein